MVYSLNAHKVFHGAPQKNDYLSALNLTTTQRDSLIFARDEVRDALSSGIRLWNQNFAMDSLFESAAYKSLGRDVVLRPKFRMQGSFSYGTVNAPAHMPPQQIDLDDGMYIPVPFVDGEPILTARGYFHAVEKILTDTVCKKHGWQLDKNKTSCVRLILGKDAHLDIPLYAVPETTYSKAHKLFETMYGMDSADYLEEQNELTEEFYRSIDKDEVKLALRNEKWDDSNAEALDDWFRAAMKRHGEVLRHCCRFLKGWRDQNWQDPDTCKLTSISLMVATVYIMDEDKTVIEPGRHDITMINLTGALVEVLKHKIENPVIDNKFLCAKWTPADRTEFIEFAKTLHEGLTRAIWNNYNQQDAINRYTACFGKRIPSDPTLVVPEKAQVRVFAKEPEVLAAPAVGRTVSG